MLALLLFYLGMSQIAHAQWSRTAPNVYLTTGSDKVGIGTTSPPTKLYINDQTAVSSFTGINNAGVRIHSLDNSSNNYALFGFSGLSKAYSNRNLAQIGANFTSSGSSIFFGTSNSYGSGITNTAMTINPHGYVGIGTTSPALILDVNGDAVFNEVRVGKGNGAIANNTTVGSGALSANTTGYANTACGNQALFSNTTGFFNTANGWGTLNSNTTGYQNTANGYSALYFNSTGIQNTASGFNALEFNTTGSENTATGTFTLYSNTTGPENTATGVYALFSNTIGSSNNANGYFALRSNINGSNNVANGWGALYSNTSASYNTANGYRSLFANTEGYNNTADGAQALYANTTGVNNTAMGLSSLLSNTSGSNNTAIGFNSDVSSGDLVNATAIGASAIVTSSFQMQLGSSATIISTSGGYTIVSDGRFKDEIKTDDAPGLTFINKLRPVTYNFNYKRYDDFVRKDLKTNKIISEEYKHQLEEKGSQRQAGFIAQEVDQVCRDNNFTFNGVYVPQNSNGNYALDYSRFVVPLVKAVQELSAQNDKLKEEIGQLKAIVYAGSDMNNGTASISIKPATEVPLLGQNIPNPAANNTIIPFRIPKNCNSASIVISELASGKIITAMPVSCSETHLAIDAGTLAMGSYTYSLYINGKLVDSKQMILAK